jgi:heptosyltransferase-2
MKILAIQNRMGIGDTVIFLPYIKALYKKFNTPINILVRESSKANQFLDQTDYVDQIIILDRNKNSDGRHDGVRGSLNLINDLKKYNFDKIFIFNSSLRFRLIAMMTKILEVYQYPLFKKNKQHITIAAQKFIENTLNVKVTDDPQININENVIQDVIEKFKIKKEDTNILLGIGGSGPTKRVPSTTFLKVIEQNYDEQVILNEILNSKYKDLCIPLDELSIKETLPIIKSCNVSICNDTSYSHLSAALGIQTITLMADTPLIYGAYSSKMFPIIPDGESTVTHDTLGKDTINSKKIFAKLIQILN